MTGDFYRVRTVGATEARRDLPRLLDEVVEGGTIQIARYGQPIATLVGENHLAYRDVRGPVGAVVWTRAVAVPGDTGRARSWL